MFQVQILFAYLLIMSSTPAFSRAQTCAEFTSPVRSGQCERDKNNFGEEKPEEYTCVIYSTNGSNSSMGGDEELGGGSGDEGSNSDLSGCFRLLQMAARDGGKFAKKEWKNFSKEWVEKRNAVHEAIKKNYAVRSMGHAFDCFNGCSKKSDDEALTQRDQLDRILQDSKRDKEGVEDNVNEFEDKYSQDLDDKIKVKAAEDPEFLAQSPNTTIPTPGKDYNPVTYPFETPINTPEGQNLWLTRGYRNLVAQQVAALPVDGQTRGNQLIDNADMYLNLADGFYQEGSSNGSLFGDKAVEVAKFSLDMITNFTPGVSLAKDILYLATGYDYINGQPLTPLEYSITLGSLFMPAVLSGGIDVTAKLALKLEKLSTQYESAATLYKAIMKAEVGLAKTMKSAPCLSAVTPHFKFLDRLQDFIFPVAYASTPCARVGELTDDLMKSSKDAIDAMGPKKLAEIMEMPKGSRPKDPSSYLPKEYIEKHLAKFDEGASRFVEKDNFQLYGPAQKDGTAFVLPKREADGILASANGDVQVLERELGFEVGALDGKQLVRVDMPDPKSLNVRVPSGNEAGVNGKWLPGGQLPGGKAEAVVDLGNAPSVSWSVSPVAIK